MLLCLLFLLYKYNQSWHMHNYLLKVPYPYLFLSFVNNMLIL